MLANTRPQPEYQAPGHYWIPSFNERGRAKGVGYDVRLTEYGWCCNCYWCRNPYACKHVDLLTDYLFEQDIISCLPEAKPLSPTQKFIAQGGSLVSLYEEFYNKPLATHKPTNRKQVSARY